MVPVPSLEESRISAPKTTFREEVSCEGRDRGSDRSGRSGGGPVGSAVRDAPPSVLRERKLEACRRADRAFGADPPPVREGSRGTAAEDPGPPGAQGGGRAPPARPAARGARRPPAGQGRRHGRRLGFAAPLRRRGRRRRATGRRRGGRSPRRGAGSRALG